MAVDGFRVFDAHMHIEPWHEFKPAMRATLERNRPDVDLIHALSEDPDRLIEHLDAEGVDRAVLVTYVAPDVKGTTPAVNRWMSKFTAGHRDRLLPMGSIHPEHVDFVPDAMDELVQRLGIRALKIHPSHQLIYPHGYLTGESYGDKLRDIYEEAENHQVPVTFHTGTSVFPGARNRYADPMFLDDVALDFPDMTILLAHAGRPLWYDAAFFLARRHDNVYLELSGIPPKKLLDVLPNLEKIPDKLIFGSDWPGPGVKSVRGNVEQVLDLPLSDETKRKLLWENAERVFG